MRQRIQPTVKSEGDGPFGKVYEDTIGFTAEEWGSIPPMPDSAQFLQSEIDGVLEEALERVILDPVKFKTLATGVQDTLIILNYGYTSITNPTVSCLQEALSYRSPRVQHLWGRLNWEDVVVANFPKRDEDKILDTKKFYHGLGLECPLEALHVSGDANWSYLMVDYEGYAGATWFVRNPCR